MAIGPRVRQTLGPLEPLVTDFYRSMFFDVKAFARRLRELYSPCRVLEVGCGEGALVTQMARLWPLAHFDAIDVMPRPGRLYRGEPFGVRFQQIPVQNFAAAEPGSMDLVVLCDVLHHIPWDQHRKILLAAGRALRPDGLLVIKDWVRDGSPAYWLGYLSDRFITGDRIRYRTRREWMRTFRDTFGRSSLQHEFSIPPWPCNWAFILKPGGLATPPG